MAVYRDGEPLSGTAQEIAVTTADDPSAARARLDALRARVEDPHRDFLWISVVDPTSQEVGLVAEAFALDPLLVDDATSMQQRAKVETHDDYLFVLLKLLEWIGPTSDVETGQVACFIGSGFALSVRHGHAQDSETVRARLSEHPELVRVGPMSVFWAITDLTIDQYLDVGDSIQADIEGIEQQVFSSRPADAATRIYRLNRENIEMRRAVRPLVPEAMRLVRGDDGIVPEPLKPYFRDIGDHILRANDMVEGFDSVLMTMLMASTARQDLMQNRDMRKISAWAAIIAVPTAIAGIYGMNFDDMPELHWTFGYPSVLAVMSVICLLLYRGFKKSGWL